MCNVKSARDVDENTGMPDGTLPRVDEVEHGFTFITLIRHAAAVWNRAAVLSMPVANAVWASRMRVALSRGLRGTVPASRPPAITRSVPHVNHRRQFQYILVTF